MAEDVGHVDGDLDLVVECLGPGVGVAESDGPEDVVLASVGLPAWFDDLGDAAVGGPEDPSFQPGPGLVDGPSPFVAPSSYSGHLRPQREHRGAAFRHRTRTTGAGAGHNGESSAGTSSMTIWDSTAHRRTTTHENNTRA